MLYDCAIISYVIGQQHSAPLLQQLLQRFKIGWHQCTFLVDAFCCLYLTFRRCACFIGIFAVACVAPWRLISVFLWDVVLATFIHATII